MQLFPTFHVRTQLIISVVLPSSFGASCYNALHSNITKYKKKQLQKLQNASAAFVMEKYGTIREVLSLNCLPYKGRIQMNIAKLAFNSFTTEAVSYRNQFIDLQSKSMDWFLYDINLRRERVKLYF